MLKKILIGLALIIFLLVLLEVISLLKLKTSLGSYARFWRSYATNGSFVYVALGDSGAQGIGASKPEHGYVGLLAQQIQQATGKSVRIVNLSVSGATIEDVLQKQLPLLKNYKPNLVTVEVGSNDVANNWRPQTFQAQYEQLAAALPRGTVVANIPYFGGRIRKNTDAIAASQQIAAIATKYNLPLADLQAETRTHQSIFNYSADFFHPNDRGYKNWANAFWKAIEPTLK